MNISKKTLKSLITTTLMLVAGYFLIIAYMVSLEDPVFKNSGNQEISEKALDDLGFDQVFKSQQTLFTMRDGSKIAAQHFPYDSDLTFIVLHGILSSSYTNNRFAGLIQKAANAEVYALDLRSHGSSDGQPGDVDYIGQYVDDVADIVSKIKAINPKQKIILTGHSMGGGIALRYAMKDTAPEVDGYLLFAPQLGENSPTNKSILGEEGESENNFMALHIPRLIGLALLNSLGIDHWNNLPVFFFNLPEGSPVRNYTYRSSASMSPSDYVEGLQAVNKPLLVIVGENDEAFDALAYEEVISTYSVGKFILIEGQTHNGIRHDELAMDHVGEWVTHQNYFLSEEK